MPQSRPFLASRRATDAGSKGVMLASARELAQLPTERAAEESDRKEAEARKDAVGIVQAGCGGTD